LKLLNDENVKIIDVRPVDAYSGWKCADKKRGGHIKGAKSLPSKWLNYMEWIEIVNGKEIHPENSHKFTQNNINEITNIGQFELINSYSDVNDWFKIIHYRK
jgi:thiosulfate/3-mercaptopyruvate sulfurtransferase